MTTKPPKEPARAVERRRPRAVAPANDGPVLDTATEAVIEAALAATVPILRAHLRREFSARLPYLRPRRMRERVAVVREDEEQPVDELARAKARALLDRHDGPRGRR